MHQDSRVSLNDVIQYRLVGPFPYKDLWALHKLRNTIKGEGICLCAKEFGYRGITERREGGGGLKTLTVVLSNLRPFNFL